jgi:hypothetical protein
MSARTIRAAPVHTTAGHPAPFKPRRAWLCYTAGSPEVAHSFRLMGTVRSFGDERIARDRRAPSSHHRCSGCLWDRGSNAIATGCGHIGYGLQVTYRGDIVRETL